MPERPHDPILNRDVAAKAMADGFAKQLDLLTQMANYASNLIPRAYLHSEKQLLDLLVCHVLLKQVATMIDAVEILARQGAIVAAMVPARVAFEASLYLEWMLVSDGRQKASCYYVGHIRQERLWAQRTIAGTQESNDFLKAMGDIGADVLTKRPSLETLAAQHLEQANRILAQEPLAATNARFDAYMDKLRARGHRPVEPEWYKVLGKHSVRAIAKELLRLPEYTIHYAKGSQVAHSSALSDHIEIDKHGVSAHPIRNLSGATNLINFAVANAVYTFSRVLQYYRPDELQAFGRQYLAEWRQAFLSTPQIKVETIRSPTP